MRRLAGFLMAIALLSAPRAQARDILLNLDIYDAMHDPASAQQIGTDVAFFFAGQNTPPIGQTYEEFDSPQKAALTEAPEAQACRSAFLSALAKLRERTLATGGNAVVNIVSDFKKKVSASDISYECHAGTIHVGVALKGTIVKLQS